MNTERWLLALMIVGLASYFAAAGPLDPPSGPIESSYKTLDEVEARRPVNDVFAPPSANARHVISSNGSYYLTGDLTLSGDIAGIAVAAPHVTIDLNGYTITASTLLGSPTNGVEVASTLTGGVLTLRNGTVTGFTASGVSSTVPGLTIRLDGVNLVANTTGVLSFGPVHASGCVFSDQSDDGLVALGPSVVRDCIASNNNGTGISVTAGTVAGCVSSGNTEQGFNVGSTAGGGLVLHDSAAIGNAGAGIVAYNALVRGNAVRDNDGGGIATRTSSLASTSTKGAIVGNLVLANDPAGDGVGIDVFGNGVLVDRNIVADSPFGVVLTSGDDHVITRNLVQSATPYTGSGGEIGVIGSTYFGDRAWQNLSR